MLVKLRGNCAKIAEYNRLVRENKSQDADFCLDEVSGIEDVLIPYDKWLKEMDWSKYKILQKDYKTTEELDRIYVCHLNAFLDIELLTDWEIMANYKSPIRWKTFGVADNASQVVDYFNELEKEHGDYMRDKNLVILMHPIFKEYEQNGWRWHKWGRYIGCHNSKCEYLYDEEGIDYVYVFEISELSNQQDKENILN